MSDLSKKLDVLRGGGHHVSPGLGEILEDFDKRLAALEPKDPNVKPEGVKSTIFAPNPLDGTNLKS
jgi:hypothetical protein